MQKNPSFLNFESALYSTSVSMPLTERMSFTRMFITSPFMGQISSNKFHNVVHSSYLFKNNNIQHKCQLFL